MIKVLSVVAIILCTSSVWAVQPICDKSGKESGCSCPPGYKLEHHDSGVGFCWKAPEFAAHSESLVTIGSSAERLIATCTSRDFQFSVVSAVIADQVRFFANLVANPDTNPVSLGKYEVAPLSSTGFKTAYAAQNPQIYVSAQYAGTKVQSVEVEQFAQFKNISIECE